MIEAHRGFWSMTLVKLHRRHPVIRTGPNSLSFSEAKAIKDIYGHNTPCRKDGQYIVTAGTHYHLADVIDVSSTSLRGSPACAINYIFSH